MEPDSILLLEIIIAILVLVIILVAYHIVARMFAGSFSGLQELISRFPVSDLPPGESFPMQTIRIGSVWYRNSARIIISPSGLYLLVSIHFPWIAGGMTLVPWNCLTMDGKEQVLYKRYARLKVKGKEEIFITIPGEIGKKLPIT
jgi:hypothetical protein